MAEDELIRVIWILLPVRLIDDIIVLIVDLLSLFVFLGRCVTLVVIAEELDEGSVITAVTTNTTNEVS